MDLFPESLRKMFDESFDTTFNPTNVFHILDLHDNTLKLSLKVLLNLLARSRQYILLNFVKVSDHSQNLKNTYNKLSVSLISEIHQAIRTLDILCDDYVWEKFNVGHWKLVPTVWRKTYTFTSLVKVIFCLLLQEKPYEEVIRQCDLGLLMGHPILNNILSELTEDIGQDIQQHNQLTYNNLDSETFDATHYKNEMINPQFMESRFNVTYLEKPSLEYFLNFMTNATPLIITRGIEHWPARQKWTVGYIKKLFGFRTVPVEIGSKYTSENWTQKLMTINEFIDTFMGNNDVSHGTLDVSDVQSIGYIAQHELFQQIPKLKEDIRIPDYCSLGKKKNVEINAWFGPGNTITPTHYDLKHNILTQIFGVKIIRLYPPSETKFLHPFPGKSILFNTSQIDIEDKNIFHSYPEIKHAKYCEFLLEPGMSLYIPPKWWHYVKSLTPCFSVSFWYE